MKCVRLLIPAAVVALALSACNGKREAEVNTGTAEAEVTTTLPESQVSDDQLEAAAQGAAAIAETPGGSNTAVVVTPRDASFSASTPSRAKSSRSWPRSPRARATRPSPTPLVLTTRGVENDFSAGYTMSLGNDMTLDFGGVYYYYLDVENSDALEPYVNFTTGPFTAGAKYLTKDVLWGNSGDIYLTGAYATKLPADFTFKGLIGFYVYDKSGRFNAQTAASESSGFRHLDLTLSHPLGKSGLDMSVTYILGGESRYGVDQRDTMVFGVSGAF